jgi:hypothetical protein
MPEMFYLFFRAFRVKEYVPVPARCYRWHISRHCRRENRCGNCSGTHPTTECKENQRCPNCDGQHKASSQECPKFLEANNSPKFLEAKNIKMLKRSYAAAATGASDQATAAEDESFQPQTRQEEGAR